MPSIDLPKASFTIRSIIWLLLFHLLLSGMPGAFAAGPDTNPFTSWDNRLNYFERFPAARQHGVYHPQHNPRGKDIVNEQKSEGPGKVVHGPGPVFSWPVTIPTATSATPTFRDEAIMENLFETFGYPVSDTQFQIIERYNHNRFLEQLFDPERIMWMATTIGGMQATSAANSTANMTVNQLFNAIDYVSQPLANFTAERSNIWQTIRYELFIPMAVLLLLPGAVLAQVRAIVAQGSPVLGDVNPFEGIIRSIIAIFLIPGSILVLNYGIDVSNSLTYTIQDEYKRLFGSDMYKDAKCTVRRAYPINSPNANRNAIEESVEPEVVRHDVWSPYESTSLTVRLYDPCLGVDESRMPDEDVRQAKSINRFMVNTLSSALGLTWNMLCAFQMVFLYYLWCMGPIAAALWVWPIPKLRQAFGSWCEGVIVLCFWALFWNTSIFLLAAFKGIGDSGTIFTLGLIYLCVQSCKSAFDFAGLVSEGGSYAMSEGARMAGGGGGGGVSGGVSGGGGGTSWGGGSGSSPGAAATPGGTAENMQSLTSMSGSPASMSGGAGVGAAAGYTAGGFSDSALGGFDFGSDSLTSSGSLGRSLSGGAGVGGVGSVAGGMPLAAGDAIDAGLPPAADSTGGASAGRFSTLTGLSGGPPSTASTGHVTPPPAVTGGANDWADSKPTINMARELQLPGAAEGVGHKADRQSEYPAPAVGFSASNDIPPLAALAAGSVESTESQKEADRLMDAAFAGQPLIGHAAPPPLETVSSPSPVYPAFGADSALDGLELVFSDSAGRSILASGMDVSTVGDPAAPLASCAVENLMRATDFHAPVLESALQGDQASIEAVESRFGVSPLVLDMGLHGDCGAAALTFAASGQTAHPSLARASQEGSPEAALAFELATLTDPGLLQDAALANDPESCARLLSPTNPLLARSLSVARSVQNELDHCGVSPVLMRSAISGDDEARDSVSKSMGGLAFTTVKGAYNGSSGKASVLLARSAKSSLKPAGVQESAGASLERSSLGELLARSLSPNLLDRAARADGESDYSVEQEFELAIASSPAVLEAAYRGNVAALDALHGASGSNPRALAAASHISQSVMARLSPDPEAVEEAIYSTPEVRETVLGHMAGQLLVDMRILDRALSGSILDASLVVAKFGSISHLAVEDSARGNQLAALIAEKHAAGDQAILGSVAVYRSLNKSDIALLENAGREDPAAAYLLNRRIVNNAELNRSSNPWVCELLFAARELDSTLFNHESRARARQLPHEAVSAAFQTAKNVLRTLDSSAESLLVQAQKGDFAELEKIARELGIAARRISNALFRGDALDALSMALAIGRLEYSKAAALGHVASSESVWSRIYASLPSALVERSLGGDRLALSHLLSVSAATPEILSLAKENLVALNIVKMSLAGNVQVAVNSSALSRHILRFYPEREAVINALSDDPALAESACRMIGEELAIPNHLLRRALCGSSRDLVLLVVAVADKLESSKNVSGPALENPRGKAFYEGISLAYSENNPLALCLGALGKYRYAELLNESLAGSFLAARVLQIDLLKHERLLELRRIGNFYAAAIIDACNTSTYEDLAPASFSQKAGPREPLRPLLDSIAKKSTGMTYDPESFFSRGGEYPSTDTSAKSPVTSNFAEEAGGFPTTSSAEIADSGISEPKDSLRSVSEKSTADERSSSRGSRFSSILRGFSKPSEPSEKADPGARRLKYEDEKTIRKRLEKLSEEERQKKKPEQPPEQS